MMDPRWQFFFYVVAILVWLAGFWRIKWVEQHDPLRIAFLGWALFGVPFAYNAAVAGWN